MIPLIMTIKLATLNLCLGLANKKTLIKHLVIQEKIDILCLQETDLDHNLDHNQLSFSGYNYESESNSFRSRVGIYTKTNINYVRRTDLEGLDSHLVIIDIQGKSILRLINIYRCFNPANNISARELFRAQLTLIKTAYIENCIVLGDFNLDWSKKGLPSYQFRGYFEDMDNSLHECTLTQVANFPTWSRIVNNIERKSTIDHIYCTNPLMIENITSLKPVFGDHLLIACVIENEKSDPQHILRRCWVNYGKEALCDGLRMIDWNVKNDSVQGYWNEIEGKLLEVIDTIVPLKQFNSKNECNPVLPGYIRNLINIRKRLLKKQKILKTNELHQRIKALDYKIKKFFNETKTKRVRKAILPNNTSSLWKAVKLAKDLNVTNLPKTLYENNIKIPKSDWPDRFATFFENKVNGIVKDVKLNHNVYNGTRKVQVNNKNFMDTKSVMECVKSLKIKNSEGWDRIPQRVLVDGIDVLIGPITTLMNMIYTQRTIPGQWLVSKTIPVFKNKGSQANVENYRPISNLCSITKIFEKLILKRLHEIQEECSVDITGHDQHGFKKGRSTSTLAITLQSILARALDEGKYGLVSSLDLSSAFDVVNIDLLLKRLKIVGMPEDLIALVSVWLRNRSYYVSVDGENSIIHDIQLGTIQGSILGPILYAIFVSPLFDVEYFLAFADDNYVPKFGFDQESLIKDMEKALEAITKWMRDSGLAVNKIKTEVCLFYKHACRSVFITLDGTRIESKSVINVLGVQFDSKLQWSQHVATSIIKSNKALNAIKIIRKHFNTKELLQILTSNFYSILYYNSEVWLLNNLNVSLKQSLLSTSANALKMALHYPKHNISFNNLHLITKRATPNMISMYKLSLLLYKIYNEKLPTNEWEHLNFDQYFTSRQINFMTNLTNKSNCGKNALCNRLHILNGMIKLNLLNSNINIFKIECKKLFLTTFPQ
jgi:endonuclease/exonuclease/phosphatase family metal-dependent hydrolase